MKRIFYCTMAFLALGGLFGLCYYFSFRSALLHYNREATQQNTELLEQLLEYSNRSAELLRELAEGADREAETVLAQRASLLPTAQYYLETYDTVSQTTEREELPLPGFMVGLEREELQAYLKGYMEYLPVNEYLAGLVSYEIVSFSEKEVTLRKTYQADKVQYQFYLCEQKGRVTVFYSDLRTVYEYTEILCEDLPDKVQEELRQGFYIRDAKELYGILEGYTS